MLKHDTEFIRDLSGTNNPLFTQVKAIEELNELGTAIAQNITKPDKITRDEIVAEMADVYIQLVALEELYMVTKEELGEKIAAKVNKLRRYRETVPNFGQV